MTKNQHTNELFLLKSQALERLILRLKFKLLVVFKREAGETFFMDLIKIKILLHNLKG